MLQIALPLLISGQEGQPRVEEMRPAGRLLLQCGP